MAKTRNGFTLVETLIVCVVVTILTAIATAAYFAAKESAKAASCMANLRNLGQSFALYTNDHDGNYPPHALESYNKMVVRQQEFKDSLLKYGAVDDLFYCPLDTHQRTDYPAEFYTFLHTSYWMPLEVYFKSRTNQDGAFLLNNSDIPNPSEEVLLCDHPWIEEKNGTEVWKTSHGDTYNSLFFDGHVKSMAAGKP
jgi:prepilin-type N-terminal cleavage/methylation domain-containing protein/prepilin-type processing-associated H-X9-DG protein